MATLELDYESRASSGVSDSATGPPGPLVHACPGEDIIDDRILARRDGGSEPPSQLYFLSHYQSMTAAPRFDIANADLLRERGKPSQVRKIAREGALASENNSLSIGIDSDIEDGTLTRRGIGPY